MATGITSSGITRVCGYPDCSATYRPRSLFKESNFCPDHSGHNASIKAKRAGLWTPEFRAIDGEGMGNGSEHRYVLLGVGQVQTEWPGGVEDITQIFDALYSGFRAEPNAAWVGFFLSYDYNMWLRLLPRERAWLLLSPAGQAKRVHRVQHIPPHPVEFEGWQFDMLGYKRFKLRPKTCSCRNATCRCAKAQWMYVNDAGPFFQASLLSVIDPSKWDVPVLSPGEFAMIKEGKERRDSAVLDEDMKKYNRLENDVLERVMARLNAGFVAAGVKLRKQQWFGPGQAAQAWMGIDAKLEGAKTAIAALPSAVAMAAIATYYGGWFEIIYHGHVHGITHEYDRNSAYPNIAAQLPCLCGTWKTSRAAVPAPDGRLRMLRCVVQGSDPRMGPLPYRTDSGSILRPLHTEGWYWQHEVEAARAAGLIDSCEVSLWHEYRPCSHPPPLRGLVGLYEHRQRVGKDTPEGKAAKLLYNSIYGKLAQSLGHPLYANPIYASLITAGCRTEILDAIATHPRRSAAVVMVATDGVVFASPHPDLTVSDKLGDWSYERRENLTLFKPGVYWDDKARAAIADGRAPQFKARGISAATFADSIARIDAEFDAWRDDASFQPQWKLEEGTPRNMWPAISFTSRFAQISVTQALAWTDGAKDKEDQKVRYIRDAGRIIHDQELTQDSRPQDKRIPLHLEHDAYGWASQPWRLGSAYGESKPYDKRFGISIDQEEWAQFVTPDGPVQMEFRQAMGVG